MCLAGAEEAIRLAPIADDNPARRIIDCIDLMVFKYVDYTANALGMSYMRDRSTRPD